jgi:CHAD domain-containing protein
MTTSEGSDVVQAPLAVVPAAQVPVEGESRPLLAAAAKRHETLMGLLVARSGVTFVQALEDADLVHDLRVAARRLEEVTRILEDWMEKPTARAVRGALQSLRRAMGDLRDADVTSEHLARWRMPAALRHVARELAEGIERDRPRLSAAAAEAMASTSVHGAMLILAQLIDARSRPEAADAAESELEKTVESRMKKRQKQLRKAFGMAAMKQTAESLHDARIAAKKLRYLAELAVEVPTRRGLPSTVRFLKSVQELLGDHHDTYVILQTLQQHLRDPRDKPIRGLQPAWQKWRRASERLQAQRAARFFALSYGWINGGR